MAARFTEFKWMLATSLLLAAGFVAFPEIDLAASALFYRDGAWFLVAESSWVDVSYRSLPIASRLIIAILIGLWLLSLIRRLPRLHARRATFGFLLAAVLLGPGLLVDNVLKDNFGRARPGKVQEFGGKSRFTSAFIPTDQCRKNCSFVSGHVAGTAFLMAFGWLAAPAVRRRWLLASIAASIWMGYVRVVMGGHFLSDVIFAWFAVYFSLWATEWAFRRLGWLPPENVSPTPPGR